VHSFVSADQLIREGQSWHQSSFLKPENRAERAREEDAFNSSKSYQSLCIRVLGVDPLECPISFLANNWDVLDCLEKEVLFMRIRDIGIY